MTANSGGREVPWERLGVGREKGIEAVCFLPSIKKLAYISPKKKLRTGRYERLTEAGVCDRKWAIAGRTFCKGR